MYSAMVHRILVQFAYWFKAGLEDNGGFLSKLYQIMVQCAYWILVEFLLDKTAGPVLGLDFVPPDVYIHVP